MSHAVCQAGHCRMAIPLIFFMGLMLLFFPIIARAAYIAPERLPGITPINAEQFIALAQQEAVVIVDSRLTVDRSQGFIEYSVGLLDTATNCDSLATLAPKVTTHLLFYCNGVKCPRSSRAATIAQACGYKRVFWLRGGFDEWKQKKYPYLKQ